jgi:Do/DeqQ family serine protease
MWYRRSALVTAVTFLFYLGGQGAAHAALPVAVDGQPMPSLAPMLKRVTPAVVNIATRGAANVRESPLLRDPFFRRFFSLPETVRRKPTSSLGSGVIVDASAGLVITNHHVVKDAAEITVTLRDGARYKAQLVGTDAETDVALIRIEAAQLTAVAVADSDALEVGDFVVAIGNPFGLGQTVTSGIVSALGRTGLGIEGYEDFIQTDASINVGNSGGALVNLRGELVGINTAILAPGGGSVGIGFAIPVNMALRVAEHLVSHGRVRRGLLGVEAQDLTPELADAFGLPPKGGAVVVAVHGGSAAAEAGIRAGDVVLVVNGRATPSSAQVRNAIGLMRVGETVNLRLLRAGSHLEVAATLRAPDASVLAGEDLHVGLAGAVFADVPTNHPMHGRLHGALVALVERGSPAARRGLRPGDLIIAVNRERTESIAKLRGITAQADGSLILNLRRGNDGLTLLVR